MPCATKIAFEHQKNEYIAAKTSVELLYQHLEVTITWNVSMNGLIAWPFENLLRGTIYEIVDDLKVLHTFATMNNIYFYKTYILLK